MVDQDEREVFRRHGAEGVLLLGGGAALLLQLADPRVAHGVARHSDFQERPFDRLFGTLDYIYAVGFGDEDLADAAVRGVNAAHVPVRGSAGDGRPAYSAFDADAQRWVASTLAAVSLDLRERLWGPVDEVTGDAIVRGYAAMGFRLQATRQGWPETRAEFEQLVVGPLRTPHRGRRGEGCRPRAAVEGGGLPDRQPRSCSPRCDS